MAQEHELKCWDVFYDAISRGEKTFEYILTGGQFGIEPGFVVLGLGK